MTRLYRTILGIKSGAPVGTYAVTFNVQEWFLDPDHATPFTDTEVGPIEAITIKINGVEQLTNASGVTVFNLAPGTYTYEAYGMVRYLTTRKAEITVVDTAISETVKLYACLYTPTQINSMISTESYIPVASATELDGLRNATGRRMGQGTIFDTVSDVTTGLDKKYVQCLNIVYESVDLWNRTSYDLSNVYDGNELWLKDFNNGLFFACFADFRNMRIRLYTYSAIGSALGAIGNTIYGDIDNCIAYVDFQIPSGSAGNAYVGGLAGAVFNMTISNSFVYGSILTNIASTSDGTGGIVGRANGTVLIQNCDSYVDITTNRLRTGGIVGSIESGTTIIENCNNYGAISSPQQVGGIVGRIDGSNSVVRKCSNHGNIIGQGSTFSANFYYGGISGYTASTTSRVENCYNTANISGHRFAAGIVGGHITGRVIENCYNIGLVTGTVDPGPIIGQTGGTVINTFFDQETTGFTTGVGLPRTTAQLKNGTADSFINPDGTPDLTETPANAMFTGWDALIWDFTDTTKYPELL